jgi:NADPH-dependent 7-cyano-7-deazaguanine reductase QueF
MTTTERLTVMCTGRATVTATYPLAHLCPFVDEVDTGTVGITWTTAGSTFELHALGEWLAGFAAERFTHEELTAMITALLAEQPGVGSVAVVSHWTTGGAGVVVSCSSSETRPAGLSGTR